MVLAPARAALEGSRAWKGRGECSAGTANSDNTRAGGQHRERAGEGSGLGAHLEEEVEVGDAGEHLEEEDRQEGDRVVLGRLDIVGGEALRVVAAIQDHRAASLGRRCGGALCQHVKARVVPWYTALASCHSVLVSGLRNDGFGLHLVLSEGPLPSSRGMARPR